ncbi:flagella synthesis protein FlgN [Balneatrix alpica]|uniref:Flagella synthesis protein FlgN n=1 Tax=Balneatrix alpica TaxID=75684 RepID=A0ABV5ZGC1_9GAMM|nr:flagellar protein FlgN [Balneatrix alpica]
MSDQESKLLELMLAANVQLEQLQEILVKERALLLARDHESFSSLQEDKQTLLDELAANVQARQFCLSSSGYEVAREGYLAFASSSTQQAALQDALEQMESLLLVNQETAQVNAQIVGRALVQNEQLLALLQGQHDSRKLYSASGKTKHNAPSHKLGEA